MFNPSLEQVRRFFCDCYDKRATPAALSAIESMAALWIDRHPEYHALLADPQRAIGADFPPAAGQSNPFLHLSLHLSIDEQLSIDQPDGIRAAYQRLLAATNDAHRAAHLIMDCLGETIWQAERAGKPPDSAAYLGCIERQADRLRPR